MKWNLKWKKTLSLEYPRGEIAGWHSSFIVVVVVVVVVVERSPLLLPLITLHAKPLLLCYVEQISNNDVTVCWDTTTTTLWLESSGGTTVVAPGVVLVSSAPHLLFPLDQKDFTYLQKRVQRDRWLHGQSSKASRKFVLSSPTCFRWLSPMPLLHYQSCSVPTHGCNLSKNTLGCSDGKAHWWRD